MSLPSLDDFSFHRTMSETRGMAIVFFTKRGCSSCKSWQQLLSRFQQDTGTSIYQVDAEENLGLVNEFDLFHMPALYLYRDGEFHCELQAEARLAALQTAIDNAILQPAQEAP